MSEENLNNENNNQDNKGFTYPNTDNRGYEPVEIPREPYQGQIHGFDRIHLREAPELIKQRIKHSMKYGDLNSTLSHYQVVIDQNPDIFAEHTYNEIKALFSEGKQTTNIESRLKWFEKFETYLGTLRMTKGGD